MTSQDDRKMLRDRALEKMRWTARNVSSEQYKFQEAPLDKSEFVRLLQKNFDRLDLDKSKGISRTEIVEALIQSANFTPDEIVMMQLLLRYFDFISDLVNDTDSLQQNDVITKADVEVLAQFLLNSDLSLEALYMWCTHPTQPTDELMPPPLTNQDSKKT